VIDEGHTRDAMPQELNSRPFTTSAAELRKAVIAADAAANVVNTITLL
jgi:hypothetical protein